MFGYMGKLLFINLSTGTTEVRDLQEADARNFLGGYGLGAKILYDEMPANTDPFSEESVIGFVTGAINGSGALFASRFMVVCKSPVTGGWNDANCGGNFGPALKKSGFDAVFVRGIAEKPVYIYIDDGNVEILDATDLWGKTTMETEAAIEAKYEGKTVRSALIGPAGEKKALMAAVMNDGHRAAGRGGPGAVMGSNNLKAIVCHGTLEVPIYDKQALAANNMKVLTHLKGPGQRQVLGMGTYGTGSGYAASTQSGDAGVKNWAGAGVVDHTLEVAQKIGSQGIDSTKIKKYFCANCPLGCGAIHNYPSERWDLSHSSRPEYETMGAFGSLMLNEEVDSIFRANDLCNEAGLDTISAGSTIAWAMDCFENGILSEEELDGIKLNWGAGGAIVEITEKVANGEGIGAILMNGSRWAANHFGKGFDQLVVASGIEEPQHDSRLAYGLARTYQYDPTPGRHVKGGIGQFTTHSAGHTFDYRGTGYTDMNGVSNTEINNSSGFCMFGANTPGANARIQVEAVTGFKLSPAEWLAMGLRIFNMRHAFNIREGLRRKDFTLSKRMTDTQPPFEGPLAGIKVDNELLADNFFNAIGWNLEMIPLQPTLNNLGGLEHVRLDFLERGIYPPPPAPPAPPPPPKPEEEKK